MKETPEKVKSWVKEAGFIFPVLLDSDGKVTASFAPKGVLPSLPRHQVPVASNLIIDKEGKIRYYSLLDSKNFDAKLIELSRELDSLLK